MKTLKIIGAISSGMLIALLLIYANLYLLYYIFKLVEYLQH